MHDSDELKSAFRVGGFPLVEFDRKPRDSHRLYGFVSHFTDVSTLVQILDDQTYVLNGYAVLRNDTVRRWRWVGSDEFLARAVRHKRLRPKFPEGIRLESWAEIVASIGAQFPLLTVYREDVEKDVCWIGRFVKASQRSVTIRYIRPDAVWEGPVRYRFSDITMLEFGGVYETLLNALAPPR